MLESPLTSAPYIQLKTTFIKLLSDNVANNKSVSISQFKDKGALISHLDTVAGWEAALDVFKKICEGIENPQAAAPQEETPAPIIPNATVTDGEIVE